MCGRYALIAALERLRDDMELDEYFDNYSKRYNILPTSEVPIILKNEKLKLRLDSMRFGWKFPWGSGVTMNARKENLTTSKLWKRSYQNKRCLIPISYFYEWQELPGNKNKLPWKISFKKNEIAYLPGIWVNWKDEKAGEIRVCEIITTEANEKMKEIHNSGGNKWRQPAFLDKKKVMAWLDEKETDFERLNSLTRQTTEKEMEFVPLEKIGDDKTNSEPIQK